MCGFSIPPAPCWGVCKVTEKRQRTLARWLPDIELGIVVVLCVAGVISSRVLLPAVVIVVAFWPIRWVATGQPSVRTAADWAVGLLVLMVPVTLWATADPEVTRPLVLRLLTGIALFYAIANWASDARRLRWIVDGVIVVGLGLGVSSFAIVPWGNGRLPTVPAGLYDRLSSGLLGGEVNSNVMAGSLALLAPIAWAAALFGWRSLRWPERIGAILTGLLLPGAILLSQSRGALVALAIAAVAMAALRWRFGWLAAPMSVAGGGLVIWRLGLERIAGLFDAGSSVGGLSGRPEIWSRALYMIQDFPFTGVGMGLFGRVAAVLYPFFTISPDAEVSHAHNLFLQVAVDLGLPGLVAWLALFWLACIAGSQAYRGGRATGDGWSAGLGAGLICSQIALATHGMVDAVTWGTRPAIIVWAIWGIAMATLNRQTPETLSRSSE